jgi:hypothetical protein
MVQNVLITDVFSKQDFKKSTNFTLTKIMITVFLQFMFFCLSGRKKTIPNLLLRHDAIRVNPINKIKSL